jgi:hypothetical protein
MDAPRPAASWGDTFRYLAVEGSKYLMQRAKDSYDFSYTVREHNGAQTILDLKNAAVWAAAENPLIRINTIQYGFLAKATKDKKYILVTVKDPNIPLQDNAFKFAIPTVSTSASLQAVERKAFKLASGHFDKTEFEADEQSTLNYIVALNLDTTTKVDAFAREAIDFIKSERKVKVVKELNRLEADVEGAIEGVLHVKKTYSDQGRVDHQNDWDDIVKKMTTLRDKISQGVKNIEESNKGLNKLLNSVLDILN